MEIINTTIYGTRDISYGLLTEAEVADLDSMVEKDQVIISHIGDGEYNHNIFGNVFSNYTEALKSYKAKLAESRYRSSVGSTPCIIMEYYQDINQINYYVGYVRNDWKTAKYKTPHLEGYLTIETLNGMFQEGH